MNENKFLSEEEIKEYLSENISGKRYKELDDKRRTTFENIVEKLTRKYMRKNQEIQNARFLKGAEHPEKWSLIKTLEKEKTEIDKELRKVEATNGYI